MTKWVIDYIAQPRVAAMGVRRNAVVKMQWVAPHSLAQPDSRVQGRV